MSILLSSPPLFGWGEYAYMPVQSFCFCDWANHLSYAIFMITCCFGGPCSVITVCNIFIYRAVRASRRKLVRGMPESSSVITVHGNDRNDSQPNREPDSLERNVSDSFHHCSSENKLIASTERIKIRIHTNDDAASNYDLDPTNKIEALEYDETKNNNTKRSDKVNDNASQCITPLKHNEQQINALTTKVGEEMDVRDGETSANDVTSTITTIQSETRINKNSCSTIGSSWASSVNMTRSSEYSSTICSLKLPSEKLKRKEEHRLAMSLMIVVIVFVICWMPFCVSMLIMIFAKTPVPREFHMFTLLLGYANSCCNPIIYGLMNKRVAAGFKDLYCFRKKRFRMPVIPTP